MKENQTPNNKIQQVNYGNMIFGYWDKTPTIYNIDKQEYMKFAGGKRQRMSRGDYDDYVEEMSQSEFIDKFGEEILLGYIGYLRSIEQSIIAAIGGSSTDGDSLKGDILKGLI